MPQSPMRPRHPARIQARSALPAWLLALAVLSGCASLAPPAEPARSATGLQAFRSDGCSSFPDRAVFGHADWRHCCVAHDHAYWRGGTAEQRLQADVALRSCVRLASGKPALAELMFLGVRAGGRPELNTSYRWGYGWPPGRPYGALSAAETADADALEQQANDDDKAGAPTRLTAPQTPAP